MSRPEEYLRLLGVVNNRMWAQIEPLEKQSADNSKVLNRLVGALIFVSVLMPLVTLIACGAS